VQFNSSIRPVDTGGIEIPRQQFPARTISASCGQTTPAGPLFTEFGVAWTDGMIRVATESITEPTEMILRIDVSAQGWKTDVADSDIFIVVVPSDDDLNLPS